MLQITDSMESIEIDNVVQGLREQAAELNAEVNACVFPERETRALTRRETDCWIIKILSLLLVCLIVALSVCLYIINELQHEVRGENCL